MRATFIARLPGAGMRADEIEGAMAGAGVGKGDLIAYFRTKCAACGHHRVMHDEAGKCEGVMNKPCMSGCDAFVAE